MKLRIQEFVDSILIGRWKISREIKWSKAIIRDPGVRVELDNLTGVLVAVQAVNSRGGIIEWVRMMSARHSWNERSKRLSADEQGRRHWRRWNGGRESVVWSWLGYGSCGINMFKRFDDVKLVRVMRRSRKMGKRREVGAEHIWEVNLFWPIVKKESFEWSSLLISLLKYKFSNENHS